VNREVFGLLIAAVLLAVACALPFIVQWYGDSAPPDVSAMRAYRLSQLSDPQIRDLHRSAREEHDRLQREAKERAAEFWKKHSEECSKASADVAYRARNPEACALPLGWLYIDEPLDGRSVEEIFENNILGVCNLVWTRRDAKKYECLPQD
jgi:hypothetical protein